MLSSCVKISCFRAKALLVFHCNNYIGILLLNLTCIIQAASILPGFKKLACTLQIIIVNNNKLLFFYVFRILPSSHPKWPQVKTLIKFYLNDILQVTPLNQM